MEEAVVGEVEVGDSTVPCGDFIKVGLDVISAVWRKAGAKGILVVVGSVRAMAAIGAALSRTDRTDVQAMVRCRYERCFPVLQGELVGYERERMRGRESVASER